MCCHWVRNIPTKHRDTAHNRNTARYMAISLLLTIVSVWGVVVSAQNNPYKINDNLYPAFVHLQNISSKPECLALTDSLYAMAVKLGDRKAQVAILCSPLQYAITTLNTKLMNETVAKVQREAIKYNYPQYYFYAAQRQITLLLNMGDFTNTKIHLEKLERDSKTMFHGYGEYICYQLYGNYYRVLRNEDEAIKYYEKALALAKRMHPDQDNESIYTNLAISYRYNNQIDKALATIDEGLANIKDKNIRGRVFRLLDAKCYTLYYAKRFEEAEKVYAEIMKPEFKQNRAVSKIYFNTIYHLIYIGEYDKAIAETHKIQEPYVRYSWLSQIESARGNSELALSYHIKAYQLMQQYNINLRQQDFARANAEIGNHILQSQNAELKLQSSELALHNSQLAHERQRNLTRLQHIASEKASLELANKELSIEKMRTTIKEQEANKKKQEAELKQRNDADRFHAITAIATLLLTLIIIAWLLTYIYTRRKSAKKILQKNKELLEAMRRAEESEQTKMRFLQNMSHEIRTPLNAIVGFSQLLAHQQETDDFTDEQKQEFIDLIDQNTETLTTLIDDILSLSVLEHGSSMKITLSDCLVNAICHSSLQSVKHRCPEGVKLYYTTEVDDNFTIECDSHRLQQVLTNFLTNAEKHTTEGEIHLHTSLTENKGMVTFSVTDTGEGVPKEMAENIFNRFEKLDSFVQGTGLGLNICRMIAEHLHGEAKLDVDYTGPGARFVFILPLTQPSK